MCLPEHLLSLEKKFQDDCYSDVQCKGQITFLSLYLGPQFKEFS